MGAAVQALQPRSHPWGYRLYTSADERLARDVIALKEQGIGLAAAVKQARSAFEPGAPVPTSEELAKDIGEAVCALDQIAVVAAVRRATHLLGVEAAIVDVFLPYLVVLGHQWETGQVSVAHEHFASHTIRKHVGALGLDLASAGRRVGIVACPPGERHDIAALMTAVVLSRRGWSVRFLGADTPLAAIDTVATRVRADAVVLGGTRREVFEPLTRSCAGCPARPRSRSVARVRPRSSLRASARPCCPRTPCRPSCTSTRSSPSPRARPDRSSAQPPREPRRESSPTGS
ncbi:MerR family transcriptional regulator [Janibacter melonis]|uniref:MerR family transcriptional regulator n=1 Tax=Janibacter melonis TaxID=262209 RepID=UPI0020957FD1|nr:B12-binding domain-containing protein [Janibacter melonis]